MEYLYPNFNVNYSLFPLLGLSCTFHLYSPLHVPFISLLPPPPSSTHFFLPPPAPQPPPVWSAVLVLLGGQQAIKYMHGKDFGRYIAELQN